MTCEGDESLDGDRGFLAQSERSSESQDKDEKGGWAMKKWRGVSFFRFRRPTFLRTVVRTCLVFVFCV